MNVDPKIVDILAYIGISIITALVGLIIWLAKSVVKKVDTIDANINSSIKQITEIVGITNKLSEEIREVKQTLREIPKLQLQSMETKTIVTMMGKQFEEYKELTIENNKKLNQLQQQLFEAVISTKK